jgi:Predicted integral membrane protein (DUF2269)
MYEVALFVHVSAAMVLFGGVALEVVGALGLRRARTVEQVRLYCKVLKPTEPMFPAAAVGLVVAGLYMAISRWSFDTPFVTVGLVGLVTIAAQGFSIQARTWKAVDKAAEEAPDGPVPAELRTLMLDPLSWASTGAACLAAVGAVAIMTLKPGWIACISIVAVLWVVGFVGGRRLVVKPSRVGAPSVAG